MKYICAIATLFIIAGCGESDNGNPVTPGINIDMAIIPAGTFRMGNVSNSSSGHSDEIPVHEVTLSRAFFMSRTEVTQAQYERVTGENPSLFIGDSLPAARVYWYDAVDFCNRFSRLQGLEECYSGSGSSIECDFAANGYRLPTEAEWEYACRAGTETDFYPGNMTISTCSDTTLDLAGWYCGNAQDTTHKVGMKQANSYGLYDMHGNVDEWCWDRYAGDYYSGIPVTNPVGPETGGSRVVRGGAWDNNAKLCRSSARNYSPPNYITPGRKGHFGFRVVRTQ